MQCRSSQPLKWLSLDFDGLGERDRCCKLVVPYGPKLSWHDGDGVRTGLEDVDHEPSC